MGKRAYGMVAGPDGRGAVLREPQRRRRATGALVTALLALGTAALAAAQTSAQTPAPAVQDAPSPAALAGRKYPPRVYRTERLSGPAPAIDGRLDDAAWQQGEWSGEFRQQIPSEGAAPSQRTELKVLYDDTHLYFAIRAYDDPAKVHRYPGRRDDITGDVVGICFDSYNDKRTGFEFDLTAAGSKIDLVLGNGETEWDTTWDAVWDGRVAHDDAGWSAEFRVPFNQLRYGPQPEQVWGMHAWRWIDRNQEEVQWQLIPRQNTGRMHQLGELHGIRDLRSSRRLELLPHLLGRTASGPSRDRSTNGSLGLDLKLGLTSNFTLDATVNPDFGQVEADPSVINLSAFETFYEEKRPFFLEGRAILSFELDGGSTLFYSRRVGHAPSYAPPLAGGETVDGPESTSILGALKITGKTPGGLSLGVVQSLTGRETAAVRSPGRSRDEAVEPFSSYTVARLHKDWDKGNTSLGGILTNTRRGIDDPALAFLPTDALTGGVDFARYFGDRSFVLDARGTFSRVSGDAAAILALQRSPVHYYQRDDASHLELDPAATVLSGHGGRLRFARTEKGRLRFSEKFGWTSPGLELNDLGYLSQADQMTNVASAGWSESQPKGPFRSYSASVTREDTWDFGRLKTWGLTALETSGTFRNKWTAHAAMRFADAPVETRLLRGGPALKLDPFICTSAGLESDGSRRFGGSFSAHAHLHEEKASRQTNLYLNGWLRPTRLVRLSSALEYSTNRDDLQYVATAGTAPAVRSVLGRIDQETWALTLRANLSLTPDLTVQLYASPFVSTGRFTDFKSATNTRAPSYSDRFRRTLADELVLRPDSRSYDVSEQGGGAYSFANPDFSFRQFRSNLVVRWEYRPGSALYAVWSQGRTSSGQAWDESLARNWDALWSERPDDVLLVKLSYWFGR